MWTERGLPPDWARQTVAELGSHSPMTVQTGPFGAQLHSEDYVDEGIPFILIRNLQGNSLDTSDMPHITYEDARRLSLYRLMPGDVVFSRVGRVGSCFLVEEKQAGWVISGQMLRIRLPEDAINHRYLIHILRSKPVQDRITGASVGSTRQSINTRILESLSVITPPLPEQHHIAEMLDAADEAIRQAERVIAKLKAVKAGLLHDLLTRGLDEHGHLRDPQAHPEQFKNSPLGRIPREWELSSVDSEFELATGLTLGPHRRPRQNKRRYLRVANVLREKIVLDDVYELEATDAEMVGRVLAKGDLLIVEGHANPGEIGRCAYVPPEAIGLTFQNHLFRLRCKRLHPRFALAWLNSEWVQAHWRRLCGTSSGLNTINSTMLKSVPVPIPEDQEQRCIATILDTHGARTWAEEAELAKLYQVKRGLMDDLLTGRVRVSP